MAKYELSKSSEAYIRNKVHNWYEEAQNKLDDWYNNEIDILTWEYGKKMQSATDEDDEEEVEQWYSKAEDDLNYKHRELERSLDKEKESLNGFIEKRLFDRYYYDKQYIVDFKDHSIIEFDGNEFSMQFNGFWYNMYTPLAIYTSMEVSSLGLNDVEDENTYAMR